MGAWIETSPNGGKLFEQVSHPMWVRGLKLASDWQTFCEVVAPYVGAWIETACPPSVLHDICVAPYVGAWIETMPNL